MIGETVSHYRITELLGGGGMGVVYKAQDLRLGRTVALKFLPLDLSRDAEAVERFRNEARAASSLDHPGICTIYDIDETPDGRLFIAMAFCEGETLRARIGRGPLPLPDALRISRQVADALAQAHKYGIVHRDIKPANLILSSDGMVRIVDFGLAKLSDSPSLTQTGARLGTPLYMSPEQATGASLDERTDLWSLGAVLFEMLTGRPAFDRPDSASVVAAISRDEPPNLEQVRPGLPPMVTSIVRRLLSKDPRQRYASAAQLSEDLGAAEQSRIDGPTRTAPGRGGVRSSRRILLIAATLIAAFVIVAIATWSWRTSTQAGAQPRPESRVRIAVLPFANLGSADDEYFAAGISEEITSRLAGVSRLAVPSTTTVTQYDRRAKSLRQIGTDLGVEYVVEGAVRWARGSEGSMVRITPKLVRVSDDTSVWTHSYDATLSDVFKVQSEIAYRITGALEVALESRERRTIESRPTTNDDAYLAYLRGTTAFSRDQTNTSNMAQARAHLEQTVGRDPGFALAWSWLARVYATQYNAGAERTPTTNAAARAAARKAVDLDPSLPEGHLALAQVLAIDRDYEGALRELEIAAAGLPNSAELFRVMGGIERHRGRWRESLSAYMRGFDTDHIVARDIAVHYLYVRQYGEAHRFLEILKTVNPEGPFVPEAWALFSERGDVAASRAVLEPALGSGGAEDARIRGLLARLEWFDGRYDRALELIRGMDPAGAWLPSNFRFPAALAAAQVYESMSRREDASRQYVSAVSELEAKLRTARDDYQLEGALGLAYAGLGRSREALQHAERAVQLLRGKDAAESPLYMYLLAQTQARLGQGAAALSQLDEMFGQPGFYNVTWVERDPGFARLRTLPEFRAHAARWSSQTGDVLVK